MRGARGVIDTGGAEPLGRGVRGGSPGVRRRLRFAGSRCRQAPRRRIRAPVGHHSGFAGVVAAARVPSGRGRRWVGGRAIPLVAADSVSGGRGRGGVRRRSAPAGRWVYRPGCLPSLARAAGHAGRVSVVVSELGRPLNDQAAAAYFFGFVCLPMGSEPGKLAVTAVPLRCGLGSQFGGPLDHQASAWVGCLPFGVARPPGTPRCAPRPAAVTRRYTGRSPGRRPGSLGRYERLAVIPLWLTSGNPLWLTSGTCCG